MHKYHKTVKTRTRYMTCTKYVTPTFNRGNNNRLNASTIPYNLQDPINSDVFFEGQVLQALVSNHLTMHDLEIHV